MKIAIQGEAGSFHHMAARHWFGDDVEIVACKTFGDVFVQLKNGSADQGVVAIENSLYGSINEVYDLVRGYGYPIVGELSEHIHQNLIALPGAALDDIKTVISHPVALDQCSEFLDTTLAGVGRREYYDTAAAVKLIKQQADPSQAAIAGAWAAELSGLPVLQSRIEKDPQNYTRFVVIAKKATPAEAANKSSLLVETSHEPGALYQALGVFSAAGINLTKLQSRPIVGKVWQYQFYIDAEAAGEALQPVISELESLDCTVTVLGEYRAATSEYED